MARHVLVLITNAYSQTHRRGRTSHIYRTINIFRCSNLLNHTSHPVKFGEGERRALARNEFLAINVPALASVQDIRIWRTRKNARASPGIHSRWQSKSRLRSRLRAQARDKDRSRTYRIHRQAGAGAQRHFKPVDRARASSRGAWGSQLPLRRSLHPFPSTWRCLSILKPLWAEWRIRLCGAGATWSTSNIRNCNTPYQSPLPGTQKSRQ